MDHAFLEMDQKTEYDGASLNQLKFFIRERDYRRIEEEIKRCFRLLGGKRVHPALYGRKGTGDIPAFQSENMLEESVENSEYFIDDAFYYAESMNKLAENICQILCRNRQEEGQRVKLIRRNFSGK